MRQDQDGERMHRVYRWFAVWIDRLEYQHDLIRRAERTLDEAMKRLDRHRASSVIRNTGR